MAKPKDQRQQAKEILGEDEIPFEAPEPGGETQAAQEAEPEEEQPESVTEYYLFPQHVFYNREERPAHASLPGIVTMAVNREPIESKADVLKFLRSAEPGTYICIKVMDEMEVAPPKEANIVRSNPRTKKSRKGE